MPSTSDDPVSSHCASSTRHTTGVVAPASVSKANTASATAVMPGGLATGPSERPVERFGVVRRQRIDPVEQRDQQTVQTGERERGLGFDADN